jgi:hypothetical protein
MGKKEQKDQLKFAKEQRNISQEIAEKAAQHLEILKLQEKTQVAINKMIAGQKESTDNLSVAYTQVIENAFQHIELTEGQTLAEEQIKILQKERLAIQEEMLSMGEKLTPEMEKQAEKQLEIITDLETMLTHGEKRIKGQEELNELTTDYKKSLMESVGLGEDFLKLFGPGGLIALGVMVIKKAISFVVSTLKEMYEHGVKINKEMGVSAKNAAIVQGNILLAQASTTRATHATEEYRAAWEAVAKKTGSIEVPPETIESVTRLTSLLGDSDAATSLTRTLQSANINAKELTDEVIDMANSMKMDASVALKALADNQLELGGMTKEQAKTRAKEVLILKQMGAQMKKLNQQAGEALDIEKSLRSEMKLRMLTGKNISLHAIRAAKASGDTDALAIAQADLVASLGDDLHGNLQLQRLISEETGMSKDQMLDYNNAAGEQKRIQDELTEIKNKHGLADIEQAKQMQVQLATTKAENEQWIQRALILGGVLVTFGLIIGVIKLIRAKLGKGAKEKNPISNFFKGMGEKGVLKGAANSIVAAAAMVVIAGAVWVLGKALQEFNKVDLASLGMAAIAIAGLTAVLWGLSTLGLVVLAGAAAMVIMAASVYGLGLAIQLFKPGIFDGLSEGLPVLTSLVMLAPGLIGLAATFLILSASLLTLAVGLAAVGVFLPVLGALSSSGIFGGGGTAEDGNNGDNGNAGIIDELKGLRRDIQAQPIMINVDGRVVSEISRVQRQQNSVRTTGYGR